jgi:hypothetical protein
MSLEDPISVSVGRRAARWEWLVAFGAGLGAACIALFVSRLHGAASPDPVTYISTVESIRSGSGWGNWLEMPLVTFPPAWPIIISSLTYLGISADNSAMIWVLACLVVIPPLALGILTRCTGDARIRVIGAAAVALTPIATPWGYQAMSEVPFIVVMLAAILMMLRWMESERTSALVAAGILASCAPLIRYAGLGVPLGATAWLLLSSRDRRSALRSLIFGALSLVPLVAVAVSNLARTDSAFGERPASTVGLINASKQAIATVGRVSLWTLDAAPTVVSIALGLATLAVLGYGCVRSLPGDADEVGRPLVVRRLLGLVAIAQMAVLVYARGTAELNDIDDRLLAPASVLLVLLAFATLSGLVQQRLTTPRLIGVGLLAAWLVVGGAILTRGAVKNRDGIAYRSPRYRAATSAEFLATVPAKCRLLTADVLESSTPPRCGVLANEPWLWFGSQIRPLSSPRRGTHDLETLNRALAQGSEIYVLWSTVNPPAGGLLGIPELRASSSIEVVGQNESVTLYRLRPKPI